MNVERFDVWRLRVALMDLADDGARFLSTAEGAAFLEQLDVFFARPLVGEARRMGFAMDRDDATHMIIERFLTTLEEQKEKAPIRFAASAENPWGYLWTCALRWARNDWGMRASDLETSEAYALAAPENDESHLTPLEEVVRCCFEELAQRIPVRHHSAVYELLGWLASNPPQRLSYEGLERIAAHRYCPSLTIEQVTAVMNIAWGGRPRQAETSLMGQYLTNPEFRPSESWTHIRALHYFKNAFRAGETSSKMLTDWAS